jgi:thymidylate synthase
MEIIAPDADTLFEYVIKNLRPVDDNNVAKEIVNANLTLLDPTRNTMCQCIRKMPIRYAIGELLWYDSRNNTAKAIEPFSKFWSIIAEKDGTVNSNYGYCIHDKFDFDQWEFVKDILKKDQSSRQAIIHIKEPRDLRVNPTKDLNCTISLQFLIRNKALHLITTMRSNDVWLGLPYDVFNFTCMQIRMAMELGIDIGYYHHNAGSLHLYKKDLEKLKGGD